MAATPGPNDTTCACRPLGHYGGVEFCPLHAAARELLEALEAMLEDAPSAEVHDMRESVEQARAVIAKVR
jgi:hypothetical protein